MAVLPDLLQPGLSVVFCGTAVATASAERGHYYSGRGNRFWQLLHEAGFTPRRLTPDEDSLLPSFGIGITDLVKDVAQSHDRGLDYSGAADVAGHLRAASPRWIAFNGATAGKAASRMLSERYAGLGAQGWVVGTSRVWVLPSSSGANATMPYPEKLGHWTDLAQQTPGVN